MTTRVPDRPRRVSESYGPREGSICRERDERRSPARRTLGAPGPIPQGDARRHHDDSWCTSGLWRLRRLLLLTSFVVSSRRVRRSREVFTTARTSGNRTETPLSHGVLGCTLVISVLINRTRYKYLRETTRGIHLRHHESASSREAAVESGVERRGDKGSHVAIIFPVVMMLLVCALYAGAYIWMRRPKFGESGPARRGMTGTSANDVAPGGTRTISVKGAMDQENL